jgi:hypothetical protein
MIFPISRGQILGIAAVLAAFCLVQFFAADQPILIVSTTDAVAPR